MQTSKQCVFWVEGGVFFNCKPFKAQLHVCPSLCGRLHGQPNFCPSAVVYTANQMFVLVWSFTQGYERHQHYLSSEFRSIVDHATFSTVRSTHWGDLLVKWYSEYVADYRPRRDIGALAKTTTILPCHTAPRPPLVKLLLWSNLILTSYIVFVYCQEQQRKYNTPQHVCRYQKV
ncbi:hypothetical protein J6590_050790 [Homalodisca vitripennis]|nr:hypothetical protein J6590_050790 [Homalodisca vitripennis]